MAGWQAGEGSRHPTCLRGLMARHVLGLLCALGSQVHARLAWLEPTLWVLSAAAHPAVLP